MSRCPPAPGASDGGRRLAPRRPHRRVRRGRGAGRRTRSRCTTSSGRRGSSPTPSGCCSWSRRMLMLEGNYVHLPLKSAMHAVNPVQRLRLLRARLLRQTAGDDGSRADLPRGDVGGLPLGARPAHQLPAARAVRRDDRLPAVPGGALHRRRPTRSTSSPGSPPGMSAPPFGGRRRDHALERHADRAGGGGERRPVRRQQHAPPGWPAGSTR